MCVNVCLTTEDHARDSVESRAHALSQPGFCFCFCFCPSSPLLLLTPPPCCCCCCCCFRASRPAPFARAESPARLRRRLLFYDRTRARARFCVFYFSFLVFLYSVPRTCAVCKLNTNTARPGSSLSLASASGFHAVLQSVDRHLQKIVFVVVVVVVVVFVNKLACALGVSGTLRN